MRGNCPHRFMWHQNVSSLFPPSKAVSYSLFPMIKSLPCADASFKQSKLVRLAFESPSDETLVGNFPVACQDECIQAFNIGLSASVHLKSSSNILLLSSLIMVIAKWIRTYRSQLAQADALCSGLPIREGLKILEILSYQYELSAQYLQSGQKFWIPSFEDHLLENSPSAIQCGSISLCDHRLELFFGSQILPTAHFLWKWLQCLAAGRPLIWRPSPEAPLGALWFIHVLKHGFFELDSEIIRSGDLPNGIVQVLLGDNQTDEMLLEYARSLSKGDIRDSPSMAHVLDYRIAQSMFRHPLALVMTTPLGYEISEKNKETRISVCKQIITYILEMTWKHAGQAPCAIHLVFSPKWLIRDLLLSLSHVISSSVKMGHALDPLSTVGPVCNIRVLEAVIQTVKEVVQHGANHVCGGFRAVYPQGYFLPTTIMIWANPNWEKLMRWIHLPILWIIPFDLIADVVECSHRFQFGKTFLGSIGDIHVSRTCPLLLETCTKLHHGTLIFNS